MKEKTVNFGERSHWEYTTFKGCQQAECAVDVDAPPAYSGNCGDVFPTHRCAILDRVLLRSDAPTAHDMMIPNSAYRNLLTNRKIMHNSTTPIVAKDDPAKDVVVGNAKPSPVAATRTTPPVVNPKQNHQLKSRREKLESDSKMSMKKEEVAKPMQCERLTLTERTVLVALNGNPNHKVPIPISLAPLKARSGQNPKDGVKSLERNNRVKKSNKKKTSKSVDFLSSKAFDIDDSEFSSTSYFDADDKRILRLARTPSPPPQEILQLIQSNAPRYPIKKTRPKKLIPYNVSPRKEISPRILYRPAQLEVMTLDKSKSLRFAAVADENHEQEETETDLGETNVEGSTVEDKRVVAEVEPRTRLRKHLASTDLAVPDIRKLSTGSSLRRRPLKEANSTGPKIISQESARVMHSYQEIPAIYEPVPADLPLNPFFVLPTHVAPRAPPPSEAQYTTFHSDLRSWNSKRITESAKEKVLASLHRAADPLAGKSRKFKRHDGSSTHQSLDEYMRLRIWKMSHVKSPVQQTPSNRPSGLTTPELIKSPPPPTPAASDATSLRAPTLLFAVP